MEQVGVSSKKNTVWKSVLAVLAGFFTVALLSVFTDFVFETVGVFPGADKPELYETWMLAVALLYRSIYAVFGGYVAAVFAPSHRMRHVIILAILGTIGGIAGVIFGWELSEHWYPIALAVTAFPLVYLGGFLRTRKHK